MSNVPPVTPPPDVPTATANAIAAKKTRDAAFSTAQSADSGWASALVSLGIAPTRTAPISKHPRQTPPALAPSPSPSPPAASPSDLPGLATAKISADSAFKAADAAHSAAQLALRQALHAAGAQ